MTARPQTALGAAMVRAGINVTQTRLYQLALDTLRKHRLTRDRGFSAFERAVEDDPDLVREALLFYYERIESDMAGGQTVPVDQNPRAPAVSSNGAGHRAVATPITGARPVREPSPAELAVAARVANSLAVTVFDSFKVRDGRSIGDVRYGELRRMMSANAREAAVIQQIINHGDAPHDARVRDILKTEHLQRMIQRAVEIVDAAQ